MIAEQAAIQPPVSIPAEKKTEKKLILPKPYRYQTYAVSYLQNRGIDMEIIRFCLKTHRLYESENYHNVVFVGMDESGTAPCDAYYRALFCMGGDAYAYLNTRKREDVRHRVMGELLWSSKTF